MYKSHTKEDTNIIGFFYVPADGPCTSRNMWG